VLGGGTDCRSSLLHQNRAGVCFAEFSWKTVQGSIQAYFPPCGRHVHWHTEAVAQFVPSRSCETGGGAVDRLDVFEIVVRHRIDQGRQDIRVGGLNAERLVEGYARHFLGPTGHRPQYLRSRLEENSTKTGWKALGRWRRREGRPGGE